ncbi:MAG: hypothetical protein IKK83_04615 [Clostridia bacterium]|nr:hypothetical protein [Clostridia bacterium]
MINVGYNKKAFALLLDRAKGDRTLLEFARECGISYVQLRKFELCRQDGAPGEKLLRKLADHSVGGVSYEMLLSVTGYRDESDIKELNDPSLKLLKGLTAAQHRQVEEYAEFLKSRGTKTRAKRQER